MGPEWLNARRLDKSTAPHGPILNWALVLIIQLESIAMSHINQNHYLYVETFFSAVQFVPRDHQR